MGFLSKILERPANERPFLLIPAGYPHPDATAPEIHKKPVREGMIPR
jgi:iodotyrosine deiodinase